LIDSIYCDLFYQNNPRLVAILSISKKVSTRSVDFLSVVVRCVSQAQRTYEEGRGGLSRRKKKNLPGETAASTVDNTYSLGDRFRLQLLLGFSVSLFGPEQIN
jgi:hypothetical protein